MGKRKATNSQDNDGKSDDDSDENQENTCKRPSVESRSNRIECAAENRSFLIKRSYDKKPLTESNRSDSSSLFDEVAKGKKYHFGNEIVNSPSAICNSNRTYSSTPTVASVPKIEFMSSSDSDSS